MKKTTIFLFLFTFVLTSFGQRKEKDFLFLKNGSVLKGQIVHNDVQTTKLLSSGNLFVFQNNEIDSISKESPRLEKPSPQNNFSFENDYFFDCSAGVIAGSSGNDKDAPFVFNASFNYRLISTFYAGAGLGVEFWNESYLPVFCILQYQLRDTRFTPFINLQTGYLVPLGDSNISVPYYSSSSYWPNPNYTELDANGGFMINPSFGIRSMMNPNFGWSFSFGYRFHRLNYSGDNEYSTEYNFNRLTLRVGIIFN
ncbi:MAG: hypothetical protein A2W90_05970 [Bacteroidetes bacterium GWF2_42_66]|nr:MAG: hypothetical protein A2W92_01350 [Bacteroidetes bacterium GWA2_42_15]OFY03589.1 MAG: hypothetical protein A2W89_18695 [Bacteroidetes bacterium GWE2_42_39]OFY45954.1 MAG: hypothetical protein A2W90_05970 [Bacteroidetes bacterium GWF2_42_66]HBL75197.1 hypothetical protein [Prolixibacteraceae bacterium]HCR89747.1 hypothetical protein [Prolixibacteraceae bacterium]